MKSVIECQNSKELESTDNLESPKECRVGISSHLWNRFFDWCKKFLNNLLADTHEIQVLQKVDRHGNIYWQAYDPVTGNSFSSGSETDVCMWIEQLYKY